MKRVAFILGLVLAAPASAQVQTPGGATGAAAFAASGYANTSTSSLTEFNLASVKIPANSMGANGVLEVTAGYSITGSAGNRTATIRFATTQGNISTGLTYAIAATSANPSVQLVQFVRNANATNSQVSYLGATSYGTASAAVGASAIDTTADAWVNFNGSVAVGTDTLTLLGWDLKVWRQ